MIRIMKRGTSGKDVELMQRRLENLGYTISISGEFDKETLATVVQYQLANDLVADGLVGIKTLAALSGDSVSDLLSHSNIVAAADQLACDVASIIAVNTVESRGHGFHDDGQVVTLFERHIMRRRMLHNGIAANVIGLIEHNHPGLVSRQPGGYRGGKTENYRIKLACELHETSALESASWGQYQIMGFHWERLGFNDVNEMVTAMHVSEGAQLQAFTEFIKTDSGLHTALKNKDWEGFARRYNGRGFKKNHYDTRLASAYIDAQEALNHV